MNCRTLLLIIGLSAAHARADEFVLKTGFGISSRTLDFSQDIDQGPLTTPGTPTQPAKRTSDYNIDFKSFDLNILGSWQHYYLAFDISKSFDTQDGSFNATYTDINTNSQGEASFSFDRNDYSLTFGWLMADELSLFAGYKSGRTLTSRPGRTIDETNVIRATDISSEFAESGPFIGASYNKRLGHGIFVLTGAYAYMSGDFHAEGDELIADNQVPPNDFAATEKALSYDGHTNGLNFNISWNVPVSDHTSYYFGAKYQRYEFSADTDITWEFYDRRFGLPATVYLFKGTGTVENSETLTGFYAGMNYLF